MTTRVILIAAGLLLSGCGATWPAAEAGGRLPSAGPDRHLLSTLLPELGCGTMKGTGDSHPNDGKFYELTVKAEKAGTLSKGTVVLYVMNDVLFGTNPVPDPVVYQGTVTSLSVTKGRALAKGILSTGKPFSLRVEDNVTDAISEAPLYDYFSFSADGLQVDNAYIHEGDLITQPQNCQ